MHKKLEFLKSLFYKHFNKHLPQPIIYDLDEMFNTVTFEWDFLNGFEMNLEVDLTTNIGNLSILNHLTNDYHCIEMDMNSEKSWEKLNLEVEWNSL